MLDTANCANLAGSRIAAAAANAGWPKAHIRDSQKRTGSIATGGEGGADDMMWTSICATTVLGGRG